MIAVQFSGALHMDPLGVAAIIAVVGAVVFLVIMKRKG